MIYSEETGKPMKKDTQTGFMTMASHQTFSDQIKQPNQIWPDKVAIHYQWRSH